MTGIVTERREPNRRLSEFGLDAMPTTSREVWGAAADDFLHSQSAAVGGTLRRANIRWA